MNSSILNDLKNVSKELRRDDRSLKNRLQSILYDNRFLETKVMPMFGYPVIPNERCGLWYCNTGRYKTTSYFKSTDGHVNQWDFSTRRLNFHLLPIIAAAQGAIIIDSTRRGKKIPDALSKTVPMWCAILNYLVLESQGEKWPFDREILFVPPATVSKSERDRMYEKIPELVSKLKRLDIITGSKLTEILKLGNQEKKLLRPIWVYPGSSLLQSNIDLFTGEFNGESWEPPIDIFPIILVTVSYQCQDGVDKRHGFTYVQGAADDHELWAHSLTPHMFWENVEQLGDINKSDAELLYLIEDISKKKRDSYQSNDLDAIIASNTITDRLHLGKIQPESKLNAEIIKNLEEKYSLVIICDISITIDLQEVPSSLQIYDMPSNSKKSSRDLRTHLISIDKHLKSKLSADLPILIACNTGKDISVSILLVALCKYYNLDWKLETQDSINKTIIRKHLAKIIEKLDGRNVNPSRASLNSVNAFLM